MKTLTNDQYLNLLSGLEIEPDNYAVENDEYLARFETAGFRVQINGNDDQQDVDALCKLSEQEIKFTESQDKGLIARFNDICDDFKREWTEHVDAISDTDV